MIRWIAALLLLLTAAAAPAQDFPKLTGLVVDAAGVLTPATKADLTAKLEALQRDTQRQLVVATIPDLQGRPLDDYGYRLGRAWGVGLGDVDNGAVLFIAPNEPAGQRGPRLEVGRGLEPILTDALSSVIIREQMLPRLRANGDINGAMVAGTDAIIAQLRANPDEAKARTDAAVVAFDKTHRRGAAGGGGGLPVALVFGAMVLGFVLLSFTRGRRGRGQRYRSDGGGGSGVLPIVLWGIANEIGRSAGGGGWGGGSGGGGSDGSWGGGGFTGGGGGDFGGGGASGDW